MVVFFTCQKKRRVSPSNSSSKLAYYAFAVHLTQLLVSINFWPENFRSGIEELTTIFLEERKIFEREKNKQIFDLF